MAGVGESSTINRPGKLNEEKKSDRACLPGWRIKSTDTVFIAPE